MLKKTVGVSEVVRQLTIISAELVSCLLKKRHLILSQGTAKEKTKYA
jgi:hypothetical protein